MKSTTTKKLSCLLLLCAMLCLAALMPMKSFADEKIGWNCNGKTEAVMEVEVGQTFYFNRYISQMLNRFMGYFTYIKDNWSSSDPSVAVINAQSSLVTTKKVGVTKIRVIYQGVTYTCTLNVRKEGTLLKGNYKAFSDSRKALEKYAKVKVTKNNFLKMEQCYQKYMTLYNKLLKVSKYNLETGLYGGNLTRIYAPESLNKDPICERLINYTEKKLKNRLTVSTVKMTGKNSIKVVFTKKLTAEDIALLQMYSEDFPSASKTHSEVDVRLFTGHSTSEVAVDNILFMKGKNYITLKSNKMKLKKGSSVVLSMEFGFGNILKNKSKTWTL